MPPRHVSLYALSSITEGSLMTSLSPILVFTSKVAPVKKGGLCILA